MSEHRDMLAGAVADLCGGDSHGDLFTVGGITGTFTAAFNGITRTNTLSTAGMDPSTTGTMLVLKPIQWVPVEGQIVFVRKMELRVSEIQDEAGFYSINLRGLNS